MLEIIYNYLKYFYYFIITIIIVILIILLINLIKLIKHQKPLSAKFLSIEKHLKQLNNDLCYLQQPNESLAIFKYFSLFSLVKAIIKDYQKTAKDKRSIIKSCNNCLIKKPSNLLKIKNAIH